MDINDITKEQLEEMDDDDLVHWYEVFQCKLQADTIRKVMLNFIDVRDAKRDPRIIKVDSKVVE